MHTALKLLQRGDEVVGLDNLTDYYDPTLKQARLKQLQPWPKFKFINADVADTAGLMVIFATEKLERGIHLAKNTSCTARYIALRVSMPAPAKVSASR